MMFFCYQCKIIINGFVGVVVVNFFIVQCDGVFGFFVNIKQGFDDIGMFCFDQVCNVQNFVFVQVEGDVVNRGLMQ